MIRIIKEIQSKNSNKIYSVILSYTEDGILISNKSSCSCIHEVFRGNKNRLCYHLKEAIKQIEEEKNEEL